MSADEDDINDKMLAIRDIVSKLGIAKFRDVPSMKIADAMTSADVVLVDVRSEEERAVSMIAGAIPREQYEAGAEAYAAKQVVCYDTVGYVAAAYACDRRRKGFSNVVYLEQGGIIGYTLLYPEGLVKPDGNCSIKLFSIEFIAFKGSKTHDVHTFMQGLGGLCADGMVMELIHR